MPGCKCRECYGAAEYFLEHQGSTYGLPPAPGHQPAPQRAKPEPTVRHLRPVETAPQPWVPRPSRRAA